MKKLLNLSLLMVGATFAANLVAADMNTAQSLKGGDATGQTFFWVRPQFQDAMPEKVSLFRNDRATARDCGWGGALQVVPFGGRTTSNTSKRLARYFMFNQKSELTVASDGVNNVDPNEGINRDINPLNFNVAFVTPGSDDADYQSLLSFRPRQSIVGAGFDYIQYFGWGDCCERKWWGEISFPVVRVRNDVRLTETVSVASGAVPAPGTAPSIAAAFTGQFPFSGDAADVWLYGKIDGRQSKNGVADVELKIGYEYIRNECSYLYSYLGVLAPTGRKPTAEFVFEPTIGENRHVGLLSGGSAGYEIWTGCGKSLWLDCDVALRYLFRNTQTRSFDLYNRPWSRYLPVYLTPEDAALGPDGITSGINLFTQRMRVRPGYQMDLNFGFVYSSDCGFQAEVGYNIWARQSEKLQLSTPWVVSSAVANIAGGPAVDEINRISNIGADFGAAGINITAVNAAAPNSLYLIQPGDLNLNSAACPATLTQIVYGTLGYNVNWCWPVSFAVGGSYEWSRINTALTRWTAWGKFGIAI